MPRTLIAGLVAVATMLSSCTGGKAQSTADDDRFNWEGLPLKPTREIHFSTTEVSWSSVDVSPDGRQVVFDLLGDLYVVSMEGGKAERITHGPAVDLQPRFSPDGSQILFLSDRSGDFNVWIVASDGSSPRQVTKSQRSGVGSNLSFVNPSWIPDGRGIVVTRVLDATPGHFYDYDLQAIGLDGKPLPGIHVEETHRPAGVVPFTASASFARNGNSLYAVQSVSPLAGAGAARDGLQVVNIDTGDGHRSVITRDPGSAVAARVSPDGKTLVYAATYPSPTGTRTGLKVLDLRTQTSTWIASEIEPSLLNRWVYWSIGLVPQFSIAPDSKHVAVAHGGKLWSIEIESARATQIPFVADVDQHLGPLLRFPLKYDDPLLTVRTIREPRRSPDARYLAFAALDRVWIQDLRSDENWIVDPNSNESQYSPSWSPDGKYLIYATWTDRGGHIKRVRRSDIDQRASDPKQLTVQPDFYDRLTYAPDGKYLVAVRAPWEEVVESEADAIFRFELVTMPPDGGSPKTLFGFEDRGSHVLGYYGSPHFSQRNPESVFLYHNRALWSVPIAGGNPDRVLSIACTGWPPEGGDVLLSPDGTRALLTAQSNISTVILPKASAVPTLCFDKSRAALYSGQDLLPLNVLLDVGGEFPWWSSDSHSFTYALGRSYFTYDLSAGVRAGQDVVARADERVLNYQPAEKVVNVQVARDIPQGDILLRGARIITMSSGQVLEHGDLLVHNNRIVAIGPTGSVRPPRGARELDVHGKTILPGYILTHEHIEPLPGAQVRRVWQYLATLAYGITTVNDPQSYATANKLTYADRVETGSLLGPRHITTGVSLSVLTATTWADILNLTRRYSRYYDSHMLKNRDAGTRHTEQLIAIAAGEERLTPVAHWMDPVSRVLDGYSGIEHATPFPWYGDIAQLIAQSGTVYTPTTIAGGNGADPMGYFRVRSNFTRETALWTFTPSRFIEPIVHPEWVTNTHARIAPEEDYSFVSPYGEATGKVVAAGGLVGVSTDGFFLGLGAHWEMWALRLGGVTSAKVLESATKTGAIALGVDNDLGSLAPGKIADLQILDRNPLDDIHNTNSIHWVMKNGRLHEAATLDEIWPIKKPFVGEDSDRPWWWSELPPWHPNAKVASTGSKEIRGVRVHAAARRPN